MSKGDRWWWYGVAGLPQRRSGWAGGLLSGGGGGDVGLSGSLAGRDTTPCDWGRARVSERGRERGDGGRWQRGEVKACLMR